MNKMLNILSEYQLKIEKRVNTITCFDISLSEKDGVIQSSENYTRYLITEPKKTVYYLFQYGDIIYETDTVEEMFDYIKKHFKLKD